MKSVVLKAFREAFPHTLPVMAGYLFMGTAFGVLLTGIGYNAIWAFFMSVAIFAGSMQFVAIGLISANVGFTTFALMTLMVNARHLFYGLSMLEKFKPYGKMKLYMIFSLTDETFSLIGSLLPPAEINKKWFYFFISILNHSYWVMGSLFGALLGSVLVINFDGLDFVMTALFIVIFTEQWLSGKNHFPAIVGVLVSFVSLLIFGTQNFIIPAMGVILLILLISNPITESEGEF